MPALPETAAPVKRAVTRAKAARAGLRYDDMLIVTARREPWLIPLTRLRAVGLTRRSDTWLVAICERVTPTSVWHYVAGQSASFRRLRSALDFICTLTPDRRL